MRSTPSFEDSSRLERHLTTIAVSLVVEFVRHVMHPSFYIGTWWVSVAAGLIVNVLYHAWSLPETHPKTIVSASFSEMSMPGLVQSLTQFASASATAFWLFLQQNMPAPPVL